MDNSGDCLLKNLRKYVILHYNYGSFREIIKNAPMGFFPKDDEEAYRVICDAYYLYNELSN